MALDEFRAEHHGHFLVVLRSDPDVAAFAIEHVEAVVAAVETERQGAGRRTEVLLDPGVHALLVDLHAVQVEAAQLTGEMPGRHLLVVLGPARGGTDLFGDIGGVESLDPQRR
ncbi:hypothetical protein D3C85_1282620 [compost metagenome]